LDFGLRNEKNRERARARACDFFDQ
jgi:hypothetical protein